ncbi:amino acid/amide ABC transporter ATP-binding protein 1 (HAAT family) [Isoptericola jiangsuensis]|uniref:Amino acid/amide ABC transporter ATP-binding protein 1 (HAAT family) n=1 Tax=Isoptericola jiangsuensis TaxID=548579 RepID=A0A2A9EXJ1_9MICO|nr:ABC transporter ATP-binding protein [Isoptericola jiangsuensis]PFG42990.1 amino acid/amide ABC transporter ATP-binding protein 1 (HAAT family) [Isoptericola jiangsuensis]
MSSQVPRLEVDGLTVTFGGLTALDDVSFSVGDGRTVALIGPNGAGKTTAFNAVCSLVRPTAGTVRIAGRAAPASPTRLLERGVARTLQGLGLFEAMTVLENVVVPLTGRPGRTDAHRATALATLDRLGLAQHAHAPVGALPYPERKRVALARALVTGPRLLLLDEPAGGLGAEDIDELADVVRRLAADGCAVLLVEHHMDFVMGLADEIVVLDFGRVVASGTPDAVRADPAVEAAYLGLEAAA